MNEIYLVFAQVLTEIIVSARATRLHGQGLLKSHFVYKTLTCPPNLTNKIRNAVTSCKCLASIICLNFAQPDGEAMAIKQVK